jgi:predicted AlkP superfamily pyrophosphatase or phosphodiesterase
MTSSKIPKAPSDVGRLSDVFVSALGAILDHTDNSVNRLNLPKLKSAVVVVIDGLGTENLESRIGHATNLGALLRSQPKCSIRCEFPSTTVVSLAGFATGERSGVHRLAGYNVSNRDRTGLVNLLTGWEQGSQVVSEWKSVATISELYKNSAVRIHVVSQEGYRRSGFTQLTMADADYHGQDDIAERVAKAHEIASQPGNLVYLYVPELDQIGHMHGSQSATWSQTLEAVDAALKPLLQSTRTAVLVTADHGMVDVPIENQIHLETLESLKNVEFLAGGDTRSAYLYTNTDVRDALQAELGDAVWVAHWQELVDAGYVLQPELVDHRHPNIVVLAKKSVTLYDRRTCKPRSLQMLGHHGSITDAEMRVPLLKAGTLS